MPDAGNRWDTADVLAIGMPYKGVLAIPPLVWTQRNIVLAISMDEAKHSARH